MTTKAIRFTKAQLQFLREELGEGFHTGFRKATGHPDASTIWRAISELPDDEYRAVVEFVVMGIEEMTGAP
jgi:hypothetical protein